LKNPEQRAAGEDGAEENPGRSAGELENWRGRAWSSSRAQERLGAGERTERGGGGGAMGSQGHGPSAAGDGEEIPPEAEHERAGKNSTGRSGRKKIGTERTRAQR
jgi:hypothetical protein